MDYCGYFDAHGDPDSCNAFARDDMCPTGQFTQIRHFCVWREYDWTEAQTIMLGDVAGAIGACVRDECQLYDNAFSIVAEYAALFLPLTYLLTYSLADFRKLHDGRGFLKLPEEATGSATVHV